MRMKQNMTMQDAAVELCIEYPTMKGIMRKRDEIMNCLGSELSKKFKCTKSSRSLSEKNEKMLTDLPAGVSSINGLYNCLYCETTADNVDAIIEHMNEKDHYKPKLWGKFGCLYCDSTTENVDDLLEHIKEKGHSQDPSAQCPICEGKVPFKELRPHYKDCFREQALQKRAVKDMCTTCGKVIHKSRMANHQNMHLRKQGVSEAEAPTQLYYYCDICGRKVNSQDGLENHKKNMHYPTPVPCPACGKIFQGRKRMKLHYEQEHNPKQCQYCEFKTGREACLRAHMAKHFEPQFKCSYCEKKLKSQKTLQAHEREHTGERPFKCDICGGDYKSYGVLLTHKQGVHRVYGPRAKERPLKRIRKKSTKE